MADGSPRTPLQSTYPYRGHPGASENVPSDDGSHGHHHRHRSPDDFLSSPCPPPAKKLRAGRRLPRIIATFFTIRSLHELIQTRVVLPPCFDQLTHLIIYGLGVRANETFLLGQPDTWYPLIRDLKQRYPQLKVLASFPCWLNHSDELIRAMRHPSFRNHLATLIHEQFDGLLFNWESIQGVPFSPELCLDNECLFEQWVVLPNHAHWCTPETVEAIANRVDIVVINSFGFLQKNVLTTTHGTTETVDICMESALYYLKRLLLHPIYRQLVKKDQLVVGMDTSGVRFFLDQPMAISLIPNKEIHRLMHVGAKVGLRKYHYKLVGDPVKEGAFLMLEQKGETISFDSVHVRKSKLKFIRQECRGVLVGDLHDDLPPEHPDSVIALALQRLH